METEAYAYTSEKTGTALHESFCPKKSDGQSKKDVSQFLMENGLTGMIASNGGIRGLAFFSLILLPGGMGLGLLRQAACGKKVKGKNPQSYWIWTAAGTVAFLTFLWSIIGNVQIPGDWIPGRWSDFNFWQEKIRMEFEDFRWCLMLPKTVFQTEQILEGLKTVLCGILSFLILGINKLKIYKNKKKNYNFL